MRRRRGLIGENSEDIDCIFQYVVELDGQIKLLGLDENGTHHTAVSRVLYMLLGIKR